MRRLLALLFLMPFTLWGADSTIGNLTTNSAANGYKFVMEDPGVSDYGITFQNLTNQILTGFVPTLPTNVITNNYSGNTPFFVSNSIVIAQTNANSGLYVTNGANYVVATNGVLRTSGSVIAQGVNTPSVTMLGTKVSGVTGTPFGGWTFLENNNSGLGASGIAFGTSGNFQNWPSIAVESATNGPGLSVRQGTNLVAGVYGSLTASNLISANTVTATNGVVQMVKGSFSTNFTCTTNLQFYLCNGTNQIVTLPNAANVPNVIYRFSTTNGYSKLIITNATGAQTVRDGTSLSYTNIGVAEVGFVSDGANWWLASRGKLVQPVAQFSCTTNIPMTLANTAYPVTFNSVDFDFSQGIVLANGTNGSASKMWITNSGIYEFDPSIVVNFAGNNTVTIWFRKDGANVANSATAIKGAAGGSIRCVTIPFVVTVAAPTAYEIWTLSTSTGDSLSFQAAGGVAPDNFPLSPSVICPVKRISDTWP